MFFLLLSIETLLRLLIIPDTQYMTNYHYETMENARNSLDKENRDIDGIIHLGDVVETPSRAAYVNFKLVYEKTIQKIIDNGGFFISAMGNHDYTITADNTKDDHDYNNEIRSLINLGEVVSKKRSERYTYFTKNIEKEDKTTVSFIALDYDWTQEDINDICSIVKQDPSEYIFVIAHSMTSPNKECGDSPPYIIDKIHSCLQQIEEKRDRKIIGYSGHHFKRKDFTANNYCKEDQVAKMYSNLINFQGGDKGGNWSYIVVELTEEGISQCPYNPLDNLKEVYVGQNVECNKSPKVKVFFGKDDDNIETKGDNCMCFNRMICRDDFSCKNMEVQRKEWWGVYMFSFLGLSLVLTIGFLFQ